VKTCRGLLARHFSTQADQNHHGSGTSTHLSQLKRPSRKLKERRRKEEKKKEEKKEDEKEEEKKWERGKVEVKQDLSLNSFFPSVLSSFTKKNELESEESEEEKRRRRRRRREEEKKKRKLPFFATSVPTMFVTADSKNQKS